MSWNKLSVMGRGSPLSPQLLLLGPAAELMEHGSQVQVNLWRVPQPSAPAGSEVGKQGGGWKVTGGQQFLSRPW